MLVGPVNALFMDEISTGLDSSTTYQTVNSLQQWAHIFNGTSVISLLQPAPETYDLFDDVILLADGHIVYQGPRELVLEFLEAMGFQCPERKGVADFLQEVTANSVSLVSHLLLSIYRTRKLYLLHVLCWLIIGNIKKRSGAILGAERRSLEFCHCEGIC